MLTVIKQPNFQSAVIALERGDVFYSAGVVPDGVGDLIRVDRIASGEMRMIARKNIISVVHELWDTKTGADHILFIRADRRDERIGRAWSVKALSYWPRLAMALNYLRVPVTMAIGGFKNALIYGDEIVVPYDASGLYGWTIKRKDAERYIAEFEAEELGRIRIWCENHINEEGREYPLIRIEGWSEPGDFKDITLWSLAEYTVIFNRRSRIIQRIMLTNEFVSGVDCGKTPIARIAIGKPLPGNLAWR